VRVEHYAQLVRAEVHRALNAGVPAIDCADHLRSCVPWYDDETIAGFLADRGANPQLRTYMWAYPAGLDWFAALAKAPARVRREVLHAAYRAPLTPAELTQLWSEGPSIGGPGGAVRLRKPSVP
jgi:hypothetical protein